MSYSSSVMESHVHIPEREIPSLKETLIEYLMKNCPGIHVRNDYAVETILRRHFGWDVVRNEYDGIIFMSDDDRNPDTCDAFLKAIAPYFQRGSWIALRGEDDYIWAIYFDGQSYSEYEGGYVFCGMPNVRLS